MVLVDQGLRPVPHAQAYEPGIKPEYSCGPLSTSFQANTVAHMVWESWIRADQHSPLMSNQHAQCNVQQITHRQTHRLHQGTLSCMVSTHAHLSAKNHMQAVGLRQRSPMTYCTVELVRQMLTWHFFFDQEQWPGCEVGAMWCQSAQHSKLALAALITASPGDMGNTFLLESMCGRLCRWLRSAHIPSPSAPILHRSAVPMCTGMNPLHNLCWPMKAFLL